MSSDTNGQSGPTHNQCNEYTTIANIHTKTRAIYVALIANIGIAAIKFLGFMITKSSAMLSESIHSLVDSFNSVCLLVGLKRSSRPADCFHPFGYGMEANVWALFAAILMFFGSLVAFHSGYEKVTGHSAMDTKILLDNYNFIAITLIVSAMFEFWAMANAAKAVLAEVNIEVKGKLKKYLTSIKYIRKIKSPTTKFVWWEDTAAFTGVLVALIALSISKFVLPAEYAYLPDGVASWLIGLILLALSLGLLKNNVNFLTGQSAEPQVEQVIKDVADSIHGISNVHELKTMDMGSSGLIVNMNIEVDPDTPVKEADDIADMLEDNIRQRVRNISHVNIEIQADDAEENWGEKFEKLIEEGKEIEAIDTNEGNILSNFSDFANTVVREVMIPRPDVKFVDVDASLDELADLIIDTGHTRIPVFEDSVDNVIGVVNAKDVLKAIRNKDKELTIKDLVREIIFVPENKFISDLLSDLNTAKSQIATVVDEHGGVAGIVTVEDILEELVGEMYDEFDKVDATPACLKVDDYNIQLDTRMSIDDINERFGLDIPGEDFHTIGGYVFGLLGREPEINDEIEDKNILYTVLEVDGRRISKINMRKETPFIDGELEESETETPLNGNGENV